MKQKIKIQLPRYKMSLSCEQFDRLYSEDMEALKRRLPYRCNDLRRRMAKTRKFPMDYILRESVGKEELRVYTSVESKHEIEKKGLDLEAVVFFRNSRGICAYLNADPFNVIGDRFVLIGKDKFIQSHRYLFTPHFFERYEMRCGWKEEFSDIHDQFFMRNIVSVNISPSRKDDYKTVDVWALCEDGLMLGQIMGDERAFLENRDYIIQLNTYLDIETLTKRQDEYRELLDSVRAYYKSMPTYETIDSLSKRTFITQIKNLCLK